MKKTVLLLLIFLPLLLNSRDLKIGISGLSTIHAGNNNYHITTTIILDKNLNQILDEKTVKIPIERYIFKGSISENIVKEDDFLYSQFSLDLDNSGSFGTAFPVTYRRGRLYINNRPFSPYLSKRTFENFSIFENAFLIQKITKKGIPLVLYEENIHARTITVGAGSKKYPLTIENFDNPSLQIIVAAPVENIRKNPPFRIEGKKNFITFTNEKLFEEQADSWAALVWTIIPLRKNGKLQKKITVTSTIRDIKPPFMVIASINLAVSGETRLRSRNKIFRVISKSIH